MNKTDLIKMLAKMRIQNDPSAANLGISVEDIDYVTETMLMGLPEATIATIVEMYWQIKDKENIDDTRIFECIERGRSSVDEEQGNLPHPLTLFNYIRYRINKEHFSLAPIDDDFLKKAIEKANLVFRKTHVRNESIEVLKEAFRGVNELFKRQSQKIMEEQKSILLMNPDKIKSQTEKYLPQLNTIYKIMFNGFFKCAADGYAFVPEYQIKEHYGKSLSENYPAYSSPAFMKLATSFWTLKILKAKLFPKYQKLMVYQLLGKLELELSEYFFPTPGPLMMDTKKREAIQREAILRSGADIDIEEFISGNPLLKFSTTEETTNRANVSIEHKYSDEGSNLTKSKSLPTRWLSFYTYFFLPFKILTSPVNILAEYDRLIEAGYNVSLNPFDFVPIVIVDIFICLLIYGLHKRKLWGWISNWIFLALIVLVNPIGTSKDFTVYFVAVFLTALIFFLPNYIYFKKRRFLFN